MFGVKKKKEVEVLEEKLSDMEEGLISTYNLIHSVIRKHTIEYTGSRMVHGNVFVQPSVYLYNNINDYIHILKDELSKKEQELDHVRKQNERREQETSYERTNSQSTLHRL